MRSPRPLRSKVKERPVFQKIIYSQCWEDPTIAADGLQLGENDDLLCLTSAGCNVMALSLRRPKSIIALDFSSAQNALLELKIAALRTLSWGDYTAFLGARPSDRRVSTYETHVRRALPDAARAYFDANHRSIAKGVIHTGRFQRYLRLFRTTMLPLIHNRATIEEFMTLEDPNIRREYYMTHWENKRWRALFTMFFGRAVMARLGRDPAFFEYVEEKQVGLMFLERCRRAMLDTSPLENHYLQYAVLGRYPDLERGPEYLRESNFAALRDATQSIRIEQGDLEGFLSTLESGALSKLYLSDLFEWVSTEHHEAMLRAIASVTRPAGRFVYWNLLVPRSRPDSLSELIAVHTEESQALHARDLAIVYGSFHVESVTS